jgi:hypothetical protein
MARRKGTGKGNMNEFRKLFHNERGWAGAPRQQDPDFHRWLSRRPGKHACEGAA